MFSQVQIKIAGRNSHLAVSINDVLDAAGLYCAKQRIAAC
jgi:hypothetical protein